jgi:hypothetical protein
VAFAGFGYPAGGERTVSLIAVSSEWERTSIDGELKLRARDGLPLVAAPPDSVVARRVGAEALTPGVSSAADPR